MNSILSGFLSFASGSLLTLFALQLFDDNSTAAGPEQIQSKALSSAQSSLTQQNVASRDTEPQFAVQPAADIKSTINTAASAGAAAVTQNTAADNATTQKSGMAELEDSLYLHAVLPAVSQLGSMLGLETEQQNKLSELLQAKTKADLQSWHELQQLARQPQGDAEQLNADYLQKAQQSGQLYNEELKKILSPQQYQNYLRYERSQAQVRIQQQVQQLSTRLNKIGQLDEFQRQEIARLSPAIFSAAEEILPGTSVSPYAPSPIRTNHEALEQLRSVFSESQLKQAGL